MQKWLVLVFIGGLVIIGTWWYVNNQKTQESSQWDVRKVEKADLRTVIASTGTLNPISKVEVGSQISGVMQRIYFDWNDPVKKGQVLAHLDRTFLEGALEDAQAVVERNQALYNQSQRDYQRNLNLAKDGVVSDQELQQSQTQYLVQKANLRSAHAALSKAKINLEYATIRSPVSGIVIQRSIEEGQTVAASLSAPTLFIIAENLSQLEILVSVDESDVGYVQPGQKVEFSVLAYPDQRFTGVVRQIRLQPTVNQNVVTYTVAVSTENPAGHLLPGMTAHVDFIVAESQNALVVPSAALRFNPNIVNAQPRSVGGRGRPATERTHTVWRINSAEVPEQVRIQIGLQEGNQTEVLSAEPALKEGERILAGWKRPQSVGTRAPTAAFTGGRQRR